MRCALLLSLLLLGCRTELLPGGGDTGFDMSAPDLATPSCDQLRTAVSSLLLQTMTCKVDSDCTVGSTACGLAGVCGAYVTTATAAELKPIVAAYQSQSCGAGQPCPNCPAMPMAGCNHGLCGPPTN